ncbi:epithelial sodium channel subunit alpha-like isoform X2 [Oculina patagonica]
MSAVSKSTPDVGHGLLSQLKTNVLKCFGYTTAHGYGRVVDAESRLHRFFWLFVCALAFGTFTQQLYVITQQYMSKPLKTRTSIGHDEKLAFPQVTICNLNMIRHSKFPNNILTKYPEVLGGPKRNTSSKQRTTLGSSGNQVVPNIEDLPETEKLIQVVVQNLAEMPEEELKSYGHQIDDMILTCHFNNLECLEGDMKKFWTQFWHNRYGNCYTFNKGLDANGSQMNVLNSSQPGFGLTLEINIEQNEYVSQLSQEAGVRVLIGVQKEMPFPYEQGMSVSPGFSTAIQLRKVIIGRLDPFENNSCEARTDQFDNSMFSRYNITYTTMACKVSCLASMMENRCGCIMHMLKYDGKPVCKSENSSVVKCVNTVFEEYDNGSCNEFCQERCREEGFKTTVSLAKWPSSQYKSTLDAEIGDKVGGNHSKETSEHFLKVKVYYGELNYEVIEEEYAYTSASFLSDIGGLMGMWIGISALTIAELLELIATFLITIFKTYSKKKDRVVNVKPKENSAQTY